MSRMSVRPLNRYTVIFADPKGATYEYTFSARSRRRVKADAREWATQTEWDATLVRVNLVVEDTVRRRLLVVAGVTFATAATMIAAMMIIGLSLEGAL